MKTSKCVMIVIVSMLFVVGLCPQAWAKKQTGPAPGSIDRCRYCRINWSAPDSLPKPGSKIYQNSKYLRIRFKAPCPGFYIPSLLQDSDFIYNAEGPFVEQGEYFDINIDLKNSLIYGKKLKIGSLVIRINVSPATNRETCYRHGTFYNTIEVVMPVIKQK